MTIIYNSETMLKIKIHFEIFLNRSSVKNNLVFILFLLINIALFTGKTIINQILFDIVLFKAIKSIIINFTNEYLLLVLHYK